MEIKVKDCVDFILKNRKGIAFKDWNPDDIALRVYDKLINLGCVVDHDEEGNILGIIILKRDDSNKILHIENILCFPFKGSIKRFIQWFKINYPGWTIQGNRFGKGLIKYKTERLITIIERKNYG